MHFTLHHAPFCLTGGVLLNIEDAKGQTVRVLAGNVWITQQGSLDDVFLSVGEAHTFEGVGSAVVTAEGRGEATATLLFDVPLSIHARSGVRSKWLKVIRSPWHSSATV